MSNENILDGFMDGFAKVAEDAGLHGDQIKGLLELSLDLAQRAAHQEAFDSGFGVPVKG